MNISNEISMAYTEVLEVLNQLDKQDYEKIPKEKISLYEQLKSKNYNFKFNPNLFIEQQISNKAKEIIANIFYNYVANEEEKRIIQKKDMEELKQEEERKKLVKLNPLFERKTCAQNNSQIESSSHSQSSNNTEELSMVVVNDMNFFQRIINKLKSFFLT